MVAWGGDLEPETLLLAYRKGIFPWPAPADDYPLLWFSPDPRAILDFNDLHIPASLVRARKKASFRFTIDQAFEQVIEACASTPRPGQDGTWITEEMKDAYLRFHKLGYAHSVEAWAREKDTLVGGIYGVAVDGVFSAESMFYRKPNASKLALLFLVEHLSKQGLGWMDIQMLTPHLKALGAKEISRAEFLKKWSREQASKKALFPDSPYQPALK